MTIEPVKIEELLSTKEGENLEFKQAKDQYSFDELLKYCCAISNEGGGRVVLGVTNDRPRQVVGTKAFAQPERTRMGLMEKLKLRVDFMEAGHEDKRILLFDVPVHPVGTPIEVDGVYWGRKGDGLEPLSTDELRAIFAEAGHDFSADVCPGAALADLGISAIEDFRRRWIDKSGSEGLAKLSREQLLRDCGAVTDGGVTYAALVLFGKPEAVQKYLAQAEVVFEYRSSEAS